MGCFFLTVNNQLVIALTIFPLAILCDRFDGYIARKLGKSSDFGKELDSIADSFNYCVLPAVFAYYFGFNSILSIIILILFTLAGFWRLANFNLVGMESESKKIVIQDYLRHMLQAYC